MRYLSQSIVKAGGARVIQAIWMMSAMPWTYGRNGSR